MVITVSSSSKNEDFVNPTFNEVHLIDDKLWYVRIGEVICEEIRHLLFTCDLRISSFPYYSLFDKK